MATKKQSYVWGYVSSLDRSNVRLARRTRAESRKYCPPLCYVKRVRKHGNGYRIIGRG